MPTPSVPLSGFLAGVLALLAAAALPACGAEPESAPGLPGSTTRVALSYGAAGAGPAAETELLAVTSAGSWEAEGWTVVGDRMVLDQGDPAALMVISDEPIEVGFPGEHRPGSFNQVAVTLRLPKPRVVFVRLGAPGEEGPRSAGVQARPNIESATLVFDIEHLEWSEGLSPTVSLYMPGAAGRVGIISMALIQRPLELWAPTPAEGPGLVRLGEEARRATGLVPGRPLEGSFDARPGMQLQFSHGVPPISARRGGRHFLEVELVDEHGKERSKRILCGPEWGTGVVRLGGLSGRTRARFELVVKGTEQGLVALGEPFAIARDRAPPSVLLITSDTHRGDHLGALAGGVAVKTPVLDSLAARGILYEQAVSSTNVTRPSHVALMTGTSPRDTGVTNNADRLSDAPVTLAERFRAAGWMTYAAVSSGSLSDDRSGIGQGFDRLWAPEQGSRESAAAIGALLSWVGDAEGVPLFVWVHAFDAHTPYREREDFAGLYYPEDRDPRSTALPELEAWQRPADLRDVRDVEYVLALYRGEVSYLDRQMSRLFGNERLRSAITAFTADHGESLDAHDEWFAHGGLFLDTLHVPLILSWPGGPEGEVVEWPAQQIDVGRTLLELAGLPADDFPGVSLLAPHGVDAPRFVLSSGGLSAAVFADRWLFILHLARHPRARPELAPVEKHSFALYDLEADPGCLEELSSEHPDQVRKLRALLVDWLMEAPPEGWNLAGNSADLAALAELAELGYATGSRASSAIRWFDPDCDCSFCQAQE